MPIESLPMIGFYNQQRFRQFDPSDTANWFIVGSETGKKKAAMYPVLGRQHVRYLDQNQLIFPAEPRDVFKSVNYWYVISLNKIYRIDAQFNVLEITENLFPTVAGDVYFTYIVTGPPDGSNITVGAPTFACFTDGRAIYVYNENTSVFSVVTDAHAPPNPGPIATFGNRIVVSTLNSSQFGLSEINLGSTAFDATTCFTIAGAAIFAQAPGIIRQFGIINNTLYMFCDYVTAPWSNIPSAFISYGGIETDFPWKNNAAYNWNYGIADAKTFSSDGNIMCWLGQTREGLIQTMTSSGQQPQPISTEAIDVLIQRIVNFIANQTAPFDLNANGFLYEYENTMFYRLSLGQYLDTELVDYHTSATSIEYNFNTQTWHRCIEVNGQRNRIQRHVYFGNRHFVTVQDDVTVYEMSAFYTNDITNPLQGDSQAPDAYITEPFRYERVTPLISTEDYMEQITRYVEVDMVFGETPFVRVNGPYANTVFIVDETSTPDNPVFMVSETNTNQFIIAEQGNFPQLNDLTYYDLYKPMVELYFSDDAGISFQPADVREFSQIGQYRWRMRWYELGTAYFRCYKLVCVSPVPMVILGAVQLKERAQDEVA
jgi:hypothetical protein